MQLQIDAATAQPTKQSSLRLSARPGPTYLSSTDRPRPSVLTLYFGCEMIGVTQSHDVRDAKLLVKTAVMTQMTVMTQI